MRYLFTALAVFLVLNFCLLASESETRTSPASSYSVVKMEVTGYCTCTDCCGKGATGKTASGKKAIGKVIAAPNKYKFGTVMHIDGWGTGVVLDRGGAIKAKDQVLKPGMRVGKAVIPVRKLKYDRLDLLFPTHKAAREWGVRIVDVKVYH